MWVKVKMGNEWDIYFDYYERSEGSSTYYKRESKDGHKDKCHHSLTAIKYGYDLVPNLKKVGNTYIPDGTLTKIINKCHYGLDKTRTTNP